MRVRFVEKRLEALHVRIEEGLVKLVNTSADAQHFSDRFFVLLLEFRRLAPLYFFDFLMNQVNLFVASFNKTEVMS